MYKYFEKLSNNKKELVESLTLETQKIAIEHNFGVRDNDTIEMTQSMLIKTFEYLAKQNYKFENLDATKIKKSDLSFPTDFPEYPLLQLKDMIISLDYMPKGYSAKIDSVFLDKEIDDNITLSYHMNSGYAILTLKLKNTLNTFSITCLNEDKVYLDSEIPKNAEKFKSKARKAIGYMQNLTKSKETLDKFEHIKNILLSVQKVSHFSYDLATKILFENKEVTREELDILDLVQDCSLSKSDVGNFLVDVKMTNIFINIEDHINNKKIIKPTM